MANTIPFVDFHTHPFHWESDTITVQNIFPGDGFAAFTGRNFYSVGLHPWHIGKKKENNAALQLMEEALEFDHVILVGEAGLDKIVDTSFKEQQRVFEAQAHLAEEYQYPMIIHCVKAMNEIIELRKNLRPNMPWILHGYNGSVEMTKQLCDSGFLFSFGANLFRENCKSIQSLKYLPLDKIFFETDEWDKDVSNIYKLAAKLKAIDLERLKEEIWLNFNRIEKSLAVR